MGESGGAFIYKIINFKYKKIRLTIIQELFMI